MASVTTKLLGRSVILMALVSGVHGQPAWFTRCCAAEPVVVPSVIDLSVEDAKDRLEAAGLVLKLSGDQTPMTIEASVVGDQEPKAGSPATPGQEVEVRLRAPQSGPEPAEPNAARGLVEDHTFPNGRVTATDLKHGAGFYETCLSRVWTADLGIDNHFGPGWSDAHDVRVWSVTPDTVIIVRGGRGWRIGRRKGEVFEVSPGQTIKETAKGWEYTGPLKSSITFDERWLAVSESSPFGQVTTYTYDDQGRLQEVGLNAGNGLRYFYAAAGDRITRVEGPQGLEARYEYDEAGRLVAVTNSRQVRIQYHYDKDGYLTEVEDVFGGRSKVAREAPPATAKAPAEKRGRKYDARGLLEEQLIDGRPVRFTCDEAGRLATSEGPLWKESYEYDPFGRPSAVIGTDGLVTRLQYNALGLPVSIASPDGWQVHLQYDKHGRLTRGEDSRGNWEEYQYDEFNRVAVARRSPDCTEHFLRDEQGRLAGIDYSNGEQVRYQFDPSGKIVGETWASGPQRRWAYDEQGRCIERTDRTGLVTRFGFDPYGRKSWEQDVAHGRTTYDYPDPETIVADRPGLGRWLVRLTPWRAPLEATDPSGQAVRYLYDEYQQLTAFIERSGAAWNYAYDAAGRLRTTTAPLGQATGFLYDPAGRLSRITRDGLAWRELAYDPQGRLQTETSPTGTAAAYRYDGAGRLVELTGPDGKVAYQYTADGALSSVRGPGWSLQQTDHPNGDLARRVYDPLGLELETPVDRFGRAAGIKLNGLQAAYQYDDRGRVAAITLPGGQTLTIALDEAGRATRLAVAGAFETAITYGPGARITGIDAVGAGGQRVFHEYYTYDAVGNLTRLDAEGQSACQLAYDLDNRLAEVANDDERTSYGYDGNGNLLSVTSAAAESRWELDQGGRPLRRTPDYSYEWDAAGNLARVRGPQQNTEHTFDAAGRLTGARCDGQPWQYLYLPDGDRLGEKGPDGSRWYAYLPDGLAGLKDEAGVTWLLVYVPGTDQPLALCGSNGKTYLLVSDRLGSIRRVVDREGKVVATRDFGPFGQTVRASGEAPLAMYAGMVCDRSGLYYARQRYYDPALTRFISIDPEAGQPGRPATHNAYAYAANNPYRYKDPKGTDPTIAIPKWIPPGSLRNAVTGIKTLLRSPFARATGWGAVALAVWWAWDESELADQAEREREDAELQAEVLLRNAAMDLAQQEEDQKIKFNVPRGIKARWVDLRDAMQKNLDKRRKPLDGLWTRPASPEDIKKTGGKPATDPEGPDFPEKDKDKQPPVDPLKPVDPADQDKPPKDPDAQPPGTDTKPPDPETNQPPGTDMKPPAPETNQPTDPDAKPPGTDMGPPDPATNQPPDPEPEQPPESDPTQPTDDGPATDDKGQPIEPPATDDKGRPIEPWQRPIVDRIIDIMLGGDDTPHDPDGTGQPPAGEGDGSGPPHIPFGPDPPRIYEPPPPPWDPPKRRRPPLDPPENTPPPGPGPRTPPPQQTPPPPPSPPTKPPVKPQTVNVPNIVGLRATQMFSGSASSVLFNAGLSWNPQSLGPAPSKDWENRVARQDPPPGTRVTKGTKVTGYIYGNYAGGPPSTPAGPAKPPTEPAKPPAKPPAQPAKPPMEPGKPPGDPGKPPTEPGKPPMEPVKPPVDPGNPPTEPGKPPTEPAQPPVDPGKPPTEPGKPPTEPAQPPVDPGKPPTEPDKPPTEPAKPPVDPAKPPVDPSKPPFDPGKPPLDPGKPPVEPTTPPMEPDKPPVDPNKPAPPKPARVKVPNLVGKKAPEAREALTTLGLVPESQLGKLAPTADQVLRVYSQDPAAETEVDVPSTVKLLIYNDPDQPLVSVPDVVGKAAAEARQAITEASLVPQLQMGKAAPDAKKSLQVYSQDPGAGTEAAAQSTVNLLIYSQLEGPMVNVPDVVGKTAADARQAVTGAKLSPKLQMGQAAPSPAQALQVYRQDPAAGTRVDEGTEVQLLIYGQETDEPETPPGSRLTVPSVVGLRAPDAQRKLKNAGLVAQLNMGQSAPSADKVWIVYQQDPPSGTVSAQGDRVKVTIYDELASQPGPRSKPVPPPRQPGTLTGQWKCSCGGVWHFTQTGQNVSGYHLEQGRRRSLTSGSFDGRTFRFNYTTSDGYTGAGQMVVDDKDLKRLNWTMQDTTTGKPWSGWIARMTN